jgi:hypothetical protein
VARAGWLAGIVVSTLLLTGCSADDTVSAPPRPRTPTSPVTTTSPTPAPPELPTAARKNTKAGAVAFAHHYINLINFAAQSGDMDGLRWASQPQCRGCARLMQSIQKIYSQGGWIRTDGWSPRTWSSLGPTVGLRQDVAVVVFMPSEARKTSASSEVTNSEATKGAINFRLQYSRQRWLVAEMGLM